MTFIQVRHNIEVAHRLYELEGKCENIHGHSMWVELKLHGAVDSKGVLEGLSFGDVKKRFRGFLDNTFDHHLLMNQADPFAATLYRDEGYYATGESHPNYKPVALPGLMVFPGDPTTENLARWIAEWAADEFTLMADVVVHETSVNAASHTSRPRNVRVYEDSHG